MSFLIWNATSRGAEVRPPTLRVGLAPVTRSADASAEQPARWI